MRAYAILMMLQGHFIDTLLGSSFRDLSNPIFGTWSFLRGMTAPIFFFASGLIFVFLLMRDKAPFLENTRVKKGLRRGIELIVIGYILRITFPSLLSHGLYPGLLAVDVLHCIGLALLTLIGVFAISRYLKISYPLLLALGGASVFYFHFDVKYADWSFLPLALENYFTQSNGSVFTPIPWVGYSMLGGVLGYALNRRPQWAFGQILPLALLASGLSIHYFSSWVLTQLYEVTGWQNFLAHANFNFLAWRLGHVFISVSIFIWIAQLWRNIPKLLLRIGSETLVIYEVHFVLLYSTWFGIGLSSFWYRSLTPAQAVFGAILFLLFFVLLIAHIDRIRQYRWPWWREKIAIATRIGWKWIKEAAVIFREKAILAWRVARVRVVRWYLRRTYSAYQASGEE
ncbi:MAG: DUF1624 domain-containing protein [Lewinellaceae bacterium]|nr:DUF1624 domain-containing protein [Phaeodactylibacter sp.]MCB0613749.1 DUF1624 domain-containing protein [Phaeodactylibacter sp.]MCB9351167.1 DUF1624 domain-containing protein [Lewinellaceae bacterium]